MTKPQKPHRPSPRSRPTARALLIGSLLAFIVADCAGLAATVHVYVDPAAGDDGNAGTAAEPYRTLTHALSVAAAGHTIHLAAGTYDSNSGEVWPTHSGFPPSAEPNVPAGVTITGDGNLVRLAGPAGFDTQTALVFEATAQVIGVRIAGFEVGMIAGDGTSVVLDDVYVSGSGEIGVLARSDAELTFRGGGIYQNDAIGLAAIEDAVVTIEGSELFENHPGVEVSDAAFVTITGSDLHDNGTGISGGHNSAVSVLGEGRFSVRDSSLRDNAYVGIHMQGAADVFVGPGSVVHGNYLGIVADAFLSGAASLELDGAAVHDNDYEGVFWGITMGESFKMRDTAVTDNGDNGLFFFGDAAVIDLGTPTDPGGNDYSGNGEPLILDARPARAAPDGTIITVSSEDILTGCGVVVWPTVGPADLDCGAVTVISILNLNNRLEIVAGE